MEDRRLAIILGSAALLLIILGFLLMPGKGRKSNKSLPGKTADQKTDRTRDGGKNGGSYLGKNRYSSGSSKQSSAGKSSFSSSSSSASKAFSGSEKELVSKKAYTEKEMQELRRKRDQRRAQTYKRKLDWLGTKMTDENLSAKSRYRYRLKLIEGYGKGNEAFNKGNYADAMKEYMKGLKDPEANPETTFVCLTQMRMAAKMLKNYDLYLELLKEQSDLIENEDLSVFGIKKGKSGKPLYESRRRYVMAIKEPNGIDDAVSEIIRSDKLDERDRDEVKKIFIKDLDEFKKDFESARQQLGMGEGK